MEFMGSSQKMGKPDESNIHSGVICVCDFRLMFKFEFVFGYGFVLWNRTGEAFITQNQAVQELTVCDLWQDQSSKSIVGEI